MVVKRRHGFTLVELMVTVIVAGIAIELAWMVFGTGHRQAVQRLREADSLQQEWLQLRRGWTWGAHGDSIRSLGDSDLFQ